MSSGEVVAARSVRREVHKSIYEVLVEAEQDGWAVRRQGHKFWLYCPCGQGKVSVPGTPRSGDWAARRIRRDIRRCPDRHELDH